MVLIEVTGSKKVYEVISKDRKGRKKIDTFVASNQAQIKRNFHRFPKNKRRNITKIKRL